MNTYNLSFYQTMKTRKYTKECNFLKKKNSFSDNRTYSTIRFPKGIKPDPLEIRLKRKGGSHRSRGTLSQCFNARRHPPPPPPPPRPCLSRAAVPRLHPGALYGPVHASRARTSAIFSRPGARYGRGEFVRARAICLH